MSQHLISRKDSRPSTGASCEARTGTLASEPQVLARNNKATLEAAEGDSLWERGVQGPGVVERKRCGERAKTGRVRGMWARESPGRGPRCPGRVSRLGTVVASDRISRVTGHSQEGQQAEAEGGVGLCQQVCEAWAGVQRGSRREGFHKGGTGSHQGPGGQSEGSCRRTEQL